MSFSKRKMPCRKIDQYYNRNCLHLGGLVDKNDHWGLCRSVDQTAGSRAFAPW